MIKKNPIVRYKIIDELLSAPHRRNMESLLGKVNERLADMDVEPICRRTLEMDLRALENPPYNAEISRENRIITYAEKGFSIFTKQITEEETILLKEVLDTIGQFEGLPNFSWLDGLKNMVEKKEHSESQIISFTSNRQLANSNLIADLFDAISNKKVVRIEFAPFDEDIRIFEVHPFLLKEYNSRWFLFGYAVETSNTNKIHPIFNFAVDRIQRVERINNRAYNSEANHMEHYFDNIIGVTNYEENPILDIVFWCSERERKYVESKPLHSTQEKVGKVEERHLRKSYPSLSDGCFYRIRCKENFELIREFIGHFNGVVVVSPNDFREDIKMRIREMCYAYDI